MKKEGSTFKIGKLIFAIIIIFILVQTYKIYKTYYFNDFVRAESNLNYSKFTRDSKEKYENKVSYKIESEQYNDAVFYQTVKVKKNTPYKVSCMVKTQDVLNEKQLSNGGAQICIVNSVETSEAVKGTNEWKKIEFLFDSKNRETVDIGFRLGGNDDNSKGTAWFADFKLEMGLKIEDTNWHMACFLLENINVNIENQNVQLSMNSTDIYQMKQNMQRFQSACKNLTNNKMTVTYDLFEIKEAVKTVSYTEEHGYYIDPMDVKELIEPYMKEKEYDHIFVCIRLGDVAKNIEILNQDWIGLRWNGLLWNWIFEYSIAK